jgi:hypothetical protein
VNRKRPCLFSLFFLFSFSLSSLELSCSPPETARLLATPGFACKANHRKEPTFLERRQKLMLLSQNAVLNRRQAKLARTHALVEKIKEATLDPFLLLSAL